MPTRSQHAAVAGFLTVATFAITAGIDRPPGIPAQTSEPISVEQEAEIRDRIFYRNGETKTISPGVEPTVTEWPSPKETVTEPVIEEPVPVTPEQPAELVEPDPLSEKELLIQTTAGQISHEAPAQSTESQTSSMALLLSAGVIGIILLGGVLFGIQRLFRRFRPTLSKEAMAPPPIAASGTETSSLRLETALGVKENNAS